MADILNANSTYASGTNDTASTASDGVTLHAAKNINGALSACVDIETILGVGTTLKGSMTDLVARLAVGITAAGVLLCNDVCHEDGPRSVEGAFTIDEVKDIAEAAGLEDCSVEPKFPFRFLLTWSKV